MKNKIVILGAGESGVGAAILAQRKGYGVFVSDLGKIKEKYKKILSDHHLEFEEGKHSEEKWWMRKLSLKAREYPIRRHLFKNLEMPEFRLFQK